VTTWVLLRGLTRDGRHWGGFQTLLHAGWPEARIEPIDLPGNGSLYLQPSPTTVEGMVEHCRDVLAQRGVRLPVHVLALSMGAMVAVAWAEHHPQDLAACVLISTSLRPFSRWHQRLRPRNATQLLALMLPGSAQAKERRVLQLTTRHPGESTARLIETWSLWRREQPVSRLNALRQLSAAVRFRAPALPPRVPMLTLVGARDELVSPGCSRRLAQAWGIELCEHPTAGHDLPLDDGPWVVKQVAAWLAAPPSAGR
jgi:pimeloyl-ACP methyl ester carboxylesterase